MESGQTIAFIGLGKMGSGICANIQNAGFPLTVFNRTRSKTKPFEELGARVADSPRAAVENSHVVLTSLMDDASVLDICTKKGGIFDGLQPGAIHVGLTTILPETANNLARMHADRGCSYVAAPILGRPDAAAAAQLTCFLGGQKETVEAISSIIECFTANAIYLGESHGNANAMKVCANYMGMSQLVILGEVYTFAEKYGLSKDMICKMCKMLYGEGPMREYAKKIRDRDFDNVGFELTGGLKDATLFAKTFEDAGVSSGILSVAKANLIAAKMQGLGAKDWSALTEITRWNAGLKH